MIDGPEKLGPHGFSWVLLVDGQQQLEKTRGRLWHDGVAGGGQDADGHPDTLHASVRNSVQTRHEPCRKGTKTVEDPGSWTAAAERASFHSR